MFYDEETRKYKVFEDSSNSIPISLLYMCEDKLPHIYIENSESDISYGMKLSLLGLIKMIGFKEAIQLTFNRFIDILQRSNA